MLIADVDGKSGQIAAGDLPLIMLLGQDCTDETPDRSAVREDAHHVGARLISLLSSSCGLFDQTCFQWDTGKAVKDRMSGPALANSSAA